MIKSSQHLTGSIGAFATLDVLITAVDLGKAVLVSNWGPLQTGTDRQFYTRLKDESTVEVYNFVNATSTYAFEVIEFI